MNPVVMPFLNNAEGTKKALGALAAQKGLEDLQIFAIQQGGDKVLTQGIRDFIGEAANIHLVVWNPPMLSLSAVWNNSLDTLWSAGATEALVVNNDIDLREDTYETLLDALYWVGEVAPAKPFFVSAVGVREEWERRRVEPREDVDGKLNWMKSTKGGPDFSCYLITKECHEKYRFDEGMIPAYCVVPETPVLTYDLRWVPIGTVSPGDTLVGVDEHPQVVPGKHTKRNYRKAIVTSSSRRLTECVKITLSDGREVICSDDHKWLAKSPNQESGNYRWTSAFSIVPGWRIATPLDTWKEPSTYEEGWLAGIIDGEGNIRQTADNQMQICIAQKPGLVLDKVHQILDKLGFHYTGRIRPENNVGVVEIAVRKYALRALGQFRPVRLLPALRIDGLSTFSRSIAAEATVVNVEEVGVKEVVTIETSTKTYIANGMISHNCEDLDYHRRLMLGGDGARIFSINFPFHHVGSGTLNSMSPTEREATEQRITNGSRAYYAKKWGSGGVNEEEFLIPFGPATDPEKVCHVKTFEIQQHGCVGFKPKVVMAKVDNRERVDE